MTLAMDGILEISTSWHTFPLLLDPKNVLAVFTVACQGWIQDFSKGGGGGGGGGGANGNVWPHGHGRGAGRGLPSPEQSAEAFAMV